MSSMRRNLLYLTVFCMTTTVCVANKHHEMIKKCDEVAEVEQTLIDTLVGNWQLNDTDTSLGGKMLIYDCTDSACNFNIQSWYDLHICDVSGKLTIHNDFAEYKTTKYVYDNKTDMEYNIPVGIRFQILSNNELNLRYINADSDNAFCGMNATVEGVWIKQ